MGYQQRLTLSTWGIEKAWHHPHEVNRPHDQTWGAMDQQQEVESTGVDGTLYGLWTMEILKDLVCDFNFL